jgi:hypothetical protein
MAVADDISGLLEQVGATLDMPQHLYEAAVAEYQDVGEWLSDKDRQLQRRDPEVYPQGSFRLGTIIRPITHEDDYDIDLVYLRDLQKESTTQARLRNHLKS